MLYSGWWIEVTSFCGSADPQSPLRTVKHGRITRRTGLRQKPEGEWIGTCDVLLAILIAALHSVQVLSSTIYSSAFHKPSPPSSLVQVRRYPLNKTVDDGDGEGDPIRGRDMGGPPTRQQPKWTANSMIGEFWLVCCVHSRRSLVTTLFNVC